MACESLTVDGTRVNLNVGTSNQDQVADGIRELGTIISNLESKVTEIRELKELIPEHYGEKDELGENVEIYLDEIANNVNDNIKLELEKIVSAQDTINGNAQIADRTAAISRYRISHDNGGCPQAIKE